jgi:hypothetical protein
MLIPEIVALWETRKSENDRSLAIVGAALIDELLADLLETFFIDNAKVCESLLSFSGPIGAFGVRNQLAYALGLIDKPTYNDIKLIQKIRNKFAHVAKNQDFSDPIIAGYALSLEIPQWVGELEDEDPESERGRFISGVRGILWHLATEKLRIEGEGRRREPEAIFPLGDREGLEFE